MLYEKNASTNELQPLALPEIVTFPAEVDLSNAGTIGAALFGACRPGSAVVVADLTKTRFCDARGIRCLLAAHGQATLCGVELRVVVNAAVVLRALQVLEVDQLLNIYPTLEAALTDRGHSDAK
jgi:anti-sigma B factor antagonist